MQDLNDLTRLTPQQWTLVQSVGITAAGRIIALV
jgi:hypothetical protein